MVPEYAFLTHTPFLFSSPSSHFTSVFLTQLPSFVACASQAFLSAIAAATKKQVPVKQILVGVSLLMSEGISIHD